jgi:hypothetical protein
MPWYPTSLVPHVRLSNGDIMRSSDSAVLRFGASCPPNTAPTLPGFPPQCLSSPGQLNVNYECGGFLAPLNVAPGCETLGAGSLSFIQQEAGPVVMLLPLLSSVSGNDQPSCCTGGGLVVKPETSQEGEGMPNGDIFTPDTGVPVFSTTVTECAPRSDLPSWLIWAIMLLMIFAMAKRGRG